MCEYKPTVLRASPTELSYVIVDVDNVWIGCWLRDGCHSAATLDSSTGRNKPGGRAGLTLQGRHGICFLPSVVKILISSRRLLTTCDGLRGDKADIGTSSWLVNDANLNMRETYLYCAWTLRLMRSISLNVSSFPCCTSKLSHFCQKPGSLLGSQN
jgi:hypothetical protein